MSTFQCSDVSAPGCPFSSFAQDVSWKKCSEIMDFLKPPTLSVQEMDMRASEDEASMDKIHVSAFLSKLVKIDSAFSSEGDLVPAAASLMRHLMAMLQKPMVRERLPVSTNWTAAAWPIRCGRWIRSAAKATRSLVRFWDAFAGTNTAR